LGTIPQIIEKNGRHALLVDGQPFFMLVARHITPVAGLECCWVWSAVKAMNANTLEVSDLLGKQIESQPGKFDFFAGKIHCLSKDGNIKYILYFCGSLPGKTAAVHYMPQMDEA